MIKYLLIRKIRSIKVLMKTYTSSIIATLMVGVICIGYTWNLITINAFVIDNHLKELFIIICVSQAFIILLQKRLVVRAHPASIHFFYNSDKFKVIVRILIVKKFVAKLFLAVIIGFMLSGLCFTSKTIFLTILLFFYLIIGSLVTWQKYNKSNIFILVLLYGIACIAFVLALDNLYYTFVLCGVMIIMTIWSKKTNVDMGKYFDIASSEERTDWAGRYGNTGEMERIVAEKESNKTYNIKFDSLLKKRENAILWKALTEFFRYSSSVKIFLVFFILFAVVINRTSIFIGIPLLNEPVIAQAIGIICYVSVITTVRGVIIVQMDKFLTKHRMGFFVPFSDRKIIITYGNVGTIIGIIYSFITCVLMWCPLPIFALVLLITLIIFKLSFWASLKKVNDKIILYIFNFISFGIGVLIFGGGSL